MDRHIRDNKLFTKTPAPLNSIFRIASATKLYTAVLAMKLCESGLLDLEQTIDIWYPEIINSDAITVRMLLNHTSGLPDTFEKFSTLLISGLFANRIWKDEELIDRHNEMVYFEPGSEWKYSNANYILLGLIIEKISDLSLEQNFQQHIFEPLKLEETFYRPNENPTPFLLSGFDRSLMPFPNRHKPDQTSWSSLAVGSGAILASAMDMAIFMYALFNGDILEMHTVSQMMDFLPTKDAGENWTGYGLGIVRVNIDGKDYYGHEGLFIGFQSFMLYSPSGNFAIALAANKSQYQQDQVLSDLIKVIE